MNLRLNYYPQGQINFIIVTIRQVIICHETSTEHCNISVEQPYSHVDLHGTNLCTMSAFKQSCFQLTAVLSARANDSPQLWSLNQQL